jgi:hypothetical protein
MKPHLPDAASDGEGENRMRHAIGLVALLARAGSGHFATAQTTNATVYGSASDKTGAAIPNSRVTLIARETAVKTTVAPNEQGEFTFVPVGNYTLAAEAKGFKEKQLGGIALSAGQSLRFNIVLEVGDATSSVTVLDAAPMVNNINPEQHFSLGTEQTAELPTLQRDWTQMLNIGNGIVTNNDSASMNGLAANGVTFTVDVLRMPPFPARVSLSIHDLGGQRRHLERGALSAVRRACGSLHAAADQQHRAHERRSDPPAGGC